MRHGRGFTSRLGKMGIKAAIGHASGKNIEKERGVYGKTLSGDEGR